MFSERTRNAFALAFTVVVLGGWALLISVAMAFAFGFFWSLAR